MRQGCPPFLFLGIVKFFKFLSSRPFSSVFRGRKGKLCFAGLNIIFIPEKPHGLMVILYVLCER